MNNVSESYKAGYEQGRFDVKMEMFAKNNIVDVLVPIIDAEIEHRATQDGVHHNEWVEHMLDYLEQIIKEIKEAYKIHTTN